MDVECVLLFEKVMYWPYWLNCDSFAHYSFFLHYELIVWLVRLVFIVMH